MVRLQHALFFAAVAGLLPAKAIADEKTSNHTLGSGPDVWRIELRNADQLRLVWDGDGDSVSELRWVSWRLMSGDQYHASRSTGIELQQVDGDGNHKGAYLGLRRFASVGARINEVSRGTQLWIHAQQYPETEVLDGETDPKIRFWLETSARDLDCAGTRVCRRGDTGFTKIRVLMDLPPVRSTRCVPQNTIRLGLTREDEGNAYDFAGWFPALHPEGNPSARSVGWQRAPAPAWGGRLSMTGSYYGTHPAVAPILGSLDDVTICIASTSD